MIARCNATLAAVTIATGCALFGVAQARSTPSQGVGLDRSHEWIIEVVNAGMHLIAIGCEQLRRAGELGELEAPAWRVGPMVGRALLQLCH